MFRNISIVIIFKALWEYTRGHRAMLLIMIVLLSLGHTLELISPYGIGQIVNILQAHGPAGVPDAYKWVALLIAIKFIDAILGNSGSAIELYLTQKVNHNFFKSFYKKNQALPLLWHQDQHSGELISRFNKGNNALSTFIGAPGQLLWMGITYFGSAIILLKIMPVVGLIAVAVTILTATLTIFFDRRIKVQTTLANDLYHKIFTALTDYLGNIRTIIILHLGLQTRNDINRRLKATVPPYVQQTKLKLGRWISTETLLEFTALGCLIYILHVFGKGDPSVQIGSIVMVVNYLRQMSFAVYNSSRYYGSLVQSLTDYQGLDEINHAYAAHIANHSDDDVQLETWSTIVVDGLDFHYQSDSSTPALEDLSLNINRGQKIALVGASGGGKSTLMTVLRGLYPAQGGTLEVDGKHYPNIEPLASISTLIPQDPEIFENTIRYNITLGVTHSDEEIMAACRIACFDSVLETLPQGLDSKINEKGVNLSGGQKQRLALARGIFAIQESSLVLFDEPTSSVDSMTERQMYQNLFEAFPDICLISSIHRLNLLNQFDTIWVMERGRLVQQGSLEELLAKADGAFQQLWSAYQQNEMPA